MVLKVFDIVYVLTDGRDKTQVIANLFFTELFRDSQAGSASAIVVVLLIAVTPVLIYQVRHFRREEMDDERRRQEATCTRRDEACRGSGLMADGRPRSWFSDRR